jgi:Condensation domain
MTLIDDFSREAAVGSTDAVRDLGAIERFFYLYNSLYPAQFCIIAEIAGTTQPEQFRDAIDLVQKRHPLLNVSINGGAGQGPSFYRVSQLIELNVIRTEHEFNWQRIVEEQLSAPFPVGGAPLMRATVLHGDKRAVVVLCFHHAIADGMSGAFIVGDLLTALTGGYLSALPLLPAREDLVVARLMREGEVLPSALPPGLDMDVLNSLADLPSWRPFDGVPPTVAAKTFDREFTARLLASSRENRSTVNGAVCAAVARVSSEHRTGEPVRIMNGINIRNALGVDTGDCGVLVNGGVVDFTGPRDVKFWSLARQAVDGLTHPRSDAGSIEAAGLFETCLPIGATGKTAAGLFAARQSNMMVSNLGVVPVRAHYGSLVLSGLWGPAVLPQITGYQMIGVATLAGQMRMTHTSHDPMPNFLEDIEHELRTACAG